MSTHETETLRTVVRSLGQNEDLRTGRVSPAGFTLDLIEVPVLIRAFRSMVRQLDYDVCEMAATTYLCARDHGVAFTALPIFPARGFHHGAVVCRADAPVDSPADLAGGRVGVSRGWTVTTGVWARGIMADEHGLDLDSVTWVLSGDEHVQSYRPPANVVEAPAGRTLLDLLLAGEIDAAIGVDSDHPGLRPVIDDPNGAALRSLADRGTYPINHLLVVKDELLRRRPDVADSLVEAFTVAKNHYLARLAEGHPGLSSYDAFLTQVRDTTSADPLPFGLEANRPMLQRLVGYAVDQQILSQPIPIESMFGGPVEL